MSMSSVPVNNAMKANQNTTVSALTNQETYLGWRRQTKIE